MEGNGKKCDFGQNCKNKALNTLTNCSKLTINHLRYLKSNSKELEIAENYLILNRAGINVITITSQHLNRHICEQHRDELGIYWTRKKRTCAHPLHGDSKAKPDRGIDAVMSREIWLRLQLVAICEGNLQNHTSYICIRSPDINTTIFIFTRWTFILEWGRNQACLGNEHIFRGGGGGGGGMVVFFANKYLNLDKVENKYPGLHLLVNK